MQTPDAASTLRFVCPCAEDDWRRHPVVDPNRSIVPTSERCPIHAPTIKV